ncbi:CBS domain-containing protein [Kitasatospora sp. NPDC057541]|uniref:restriction system modified-DNA reader domain-containing protein n=1 Tax=unclassified Kitasatospora TaxID=2633591 RepID=UPI0036AAFA72
MGRESYLVEGRRVTVGDLVAAGYIEVGAKLTFERPRKDETHHATVVEEGKVRLSDGQLFRSPSTAAIAAVGRGSFDGWTAWVLDDGRTLDAVRQDFLDEMAKQAAGPLGGVEDSSELFTPAERHERLKQARENADNGRPMSVTVRELVGWWNALRRGYLVTGQIDAELANHGLVTAPSFDKVHFDSVVHLVSAAHEEDDTVDPEVLLSPPAAGPVPVSVPLDDDDDDEPEAGLTVGNLLPAAPGIVSVLPDATYQEAITKMAINDYSQLPVISGRNLRGAVTWESIARARYANPEATFSDAIIPARAVSYDHDLIDVLPELVKFQFVLVRDQKQAIVGIVTASDVAMAYGSLASPFFLVGELDQRLRRIIATNFELSYVQELCARSGQGAIVSFDSLSMGHYQQVLGNPDAWNQLSWPLDRKVFGERLDQIRKIRNDLLHFNPDPLPEDAIEKIRNMINLLREYTS